MWLLVLCSAGADPCQTQSWLLLGLVTFLAALHLSSIQLKSIQGWICSALWGLCKREPNLNSPTLLSPVLFSSPHMQEPGSHKQSFLSFQLCLSLPISHPPVPSSVLFFPLSTHKRFFSNFYQSLSARL